MNPYRLPTTVIPQRYHIHLEPDLVKFTFSGKVTIEVDIKESVGEIVLNAKQLALGESSLRDAKGQIHSATVELKQDAERAVLKFASPLERGRATLSIAFNGKLETNLRGLYRSTYKTPEGVTESLATTQFEATDARAAFPCWDEPNFKAVFASTLVVDEKLTAISNTAITGEKKVGGKKEVTFADTIPMSTYLVAYIVGKLEATAPVNVGKTPIRIWSVGGKAELSDFGRDIAAFSLDFFEKYYGRPYPGDKLDLIAIPDFQAGAMENLGAITFRETALLVNQSQATHAELERIADVVAHENAHMWFGDLVTMSWWNGLWLNEAFATFMEMLAVDAWKPEWRRWDSFAESRAEAMLVDGFRSTRPIEFPVSQPKDAEAMFDVLTYQKGAAVLRMAEQFLGPDVFREGVRRYLTTHALKNTETVDLWNALSEAAGKSVAPLMENWVFTAGFPLVTVSREGEELVLAQSRFRYLREASDEKNHWKIPVHIRFTGNGKSESQKVLLEGETARVRFPAGCDSVVVNEHAHGFYRTKYSAQLRSALLTGLRGLEPVERFNLVNDSWALVQSGEMKLTEYVETLERFREETDKSVWIQIIGSLHAIRRVIPSAATAGFERWVQKFLEPTVQRLGFSPRQGENDRDRQLRGEVLKAAGILGNDAAVKKHAESVRATDAVDNDVLAASVQILSHFGDAGRFGQFLKTFETAKTPQEEKRYLFALTRFRDAALIDRALGMTLDGTVRAQDIPSVLYSLLLNTEAAATTWVHFKKHWEDYNRLFPKTGLRTVFQGFAGLATPEHEKDILKFVEDKKVDLGGKALAQALERLRIAVRFRENAGTPPQFA